MMNALATAVTTAANLGTAIQALIGQNTPTFISVIGYTSKDGEVANHVINIGASYEAARQRDIKSLKVFVGELTALPGYGVTPADATDEQAATASQQRTTLEAANEMLVSIEKNADPAERSNQAQAQIDAYTQLGNLRIHNTTGEIYVAAFAVGKKITTAIERKKVNSSAKTIAKRKIEKDLKLSTAKRRNYIIGNVQEMAIKGQRLILGTNGHSIAGAQEPEIDNTGLEG